MPYFKDCKAVEYLGDKIKVDPSPGAYYVSVVDGPKFGLLAGPFDNHPAALGMVEKASAEAHKVDLKACWYGYGTCRFDERASV